MSRSDKVIIDLPLGEIFELHNISNTNKYLVSYFDAPSSSLLGFGLPHNDGHDRPLAAACVVTAASINIIV